MTIYIDDAMRPFGRLKLSHMVADTDEELHALAAFIGLKFKHHQPGIGHVSGSHYDVGATARAKALRSGGAVAVTERCMAMMVRHRKVMGTLGDPKSVAVWYGQWEEQRRAKLLRDHGLPGVPRGE